MERMPATRMALLQSRARHRIARRGAELLRSKREALAVELFAVVRDVVARRERLDEALRDATRALTLARALLGDEALGSLALAAGREIPLEVGMRKVWGIPVPEVMGPRLGREPAARGVSPLSLDLSAAAAAERHEEALEIMIGVCSAEVRLRRLGDEIHRTTRRVSALEEVVVPAIEREIARIGAALEERSREDLTRRKRWKTRRARGDGS